MVPPQRPVLPIVKFINPGDVNAKVCLDEKNVDQLIKRDIIETGHINKLESMIRHCK